MSNPSAHQKNLHRRPNLPILAIQNRYKSFCNTNPHRFPQHVLARGLQKVPHAFLQRRSKRNFDVVRDAILRSQEDMEPSSNHLPLLPAESPVATRV